MNADQTFRLILIAGFLIVLPIMIMLSNALAATNWFLLVGGAVVITLLAIRVRIEEAQLLARFGGAYQAYLDRTGRFFPTR